MSTSKFIIFCSAPTSYLFFSLSSFISLFGLFIFTSTCLFIIQDKLYDACKIMYVYVRNFLLFCLKSLGNKNKVSKDSLCFVWFV